MGFRDDERGQAIQVGAVLLFAILIVAFSTYQAAIIPADNRQVEFNHNQEVQDGLADLRNAVLGTADSTRSQSVTIGLGTQYPSRTLGLNPPPPSGSLRTVGTTDPLVNLTIENAVAADEETADLWDGTPRNYSTGAVRYAPAYHRYQEAPTTTYEHSVLYNRFSKSNTLVLANQSMIDGDRISLVALNGSLDRASSRSTTVDVRSISSSTETIRIQNSSSGPINISFTSLRDEGAWKRTFGNDTDVRVDDSPSPAGSEYHRIHVELVGDGPYRLAMTKAAVGTGATAEDPAYLTTVDGDGASVEKGNSQAVTLAVRDAYNNPVGGVPVASSIDGNATTDEDGRVTFTYDTTGVGPGTQRLDFTIEDPGVVSGGTFNGSTPENATADVTVTEPANGSGSGAYALEWTNPDNETANSGPGLSPCDDERCTWDVGASPGSSLALNATLRPAFEGVDLNFNVNDSSVATVSSSSGMTGSDGAAMRDLQASENGTVGVLASGNDVSDLITVEVTNVTGGSTSPALRVLHEDLSNRGQGQGNHLVSYELANPPADFDEVAVHFVNTDSSYATEWSNSTATGGTVTHQSGDTAGDGYDIEVTAYDTGGNVIDSWTVSDAADGVNTGASDDLGDVGSPSFTSYTISDESSNQRGIQYNVSYTADSSGFDSVEGYLIAQNPQAGEDSTTWTATSVTDDPFSTYGFSNQDARDMKTSLLLYDDRGVVVDRVVWVDGADGSGSTSG